jgi:hypothetical protein
MRTYTSLLALIMLALSAPVLAQEVAPPQEPPAQPASAPAAAAPGEAASPSGPAGTAAANEAAASADKKFAAPPGYKEKTRGGTTVYCRSQTPIGTRFATEYCYTQADLQRMEKSKQGMQDDVSRATRVCGSGQSCSGGG